MKSEFITIQGYDTLPTGDAKIKDGFPIKKQMTQNCKTSPYCSHNTKGRSMDKPCSISFNYPDTKVDMITVDKKILDAKYSTSTAVANNNLEGSEPVWQSQQKQK